MVCHMKNSARRLALLGSTGSIGQQALDVVRAFPDELEVVGLTAGNNLSLLSEQIAEFQPRFVSALREVEVKDAELLPPEQIAGHPDIDQAASRTCKEDHRRPFQYGKGACGIGPSTAGEKVIDHAEKR